MLLSYRCLGIRNQNVLIVEKTKKEGVNLLACDFSDIDSVDWELIKESSDLSEVNTSEATVEDGSQEQASVYEEEQPSDVSAECSSGTADINKGRVLIGKDKYLHNVYWEFNNKALANQKLGEIFMKEAVEIRKKPRNYTTGHLKNKLKELIIAEAGDELFKEKLKALHYVKGGGNKILKYLMRNLDAIISAANTWIIIW